MTVRRDHTLSSHVLGYEMAGPLDQSQSVYEPNDPAVTHRLIQNPGRFVSSESGSPCLACSRWRPRLPSEAPSLTVYYDGSCPLCRAEIGYYRKQDGAGGICFLDVSQSQAGLGPDLTQQQAMRRFHVRRGDGSIVSGAAGFVAVWSSLKRWRGLARLAQLPGALALLEGAYRLFLPVRPRLSKLFARLRPMTIADQKEQTP